LHLTNSYLKLPVTRAAVNSIRCLQSGLLRDSTQRESRRHRRRDYSINYSVKPIDTLISFVAEFVCAVSMTTGRCAV